MTSAVSVIANDDHIKQAMKTSPERVDLRVTGVRKELLEKFKKVREKSDDGLGFITHVMPVLDENGKPTYDEVDIVEYDIMRGETKCGGEARLDHLMSLDLTRPSDDWAANTAKARLSSVMEQLAIINSNQHSPLPDGHLPIEQWGGCSKHVIAVLHFNKIFSVQQVRDLTEAQVSRLPGGIHANRLRDEARAFLLREQDSMSAKANLEVSAKVNALVSENAELRAMLQQILAKIDPGSVNEKTEQDRPKQEHPQATPEDVQAINQQRAAAIQAKQSNRR